MPPKADRLTQDWTGAEATLPRDRRLMGVVRAPREVDPAIHSDSWVAWARGPAGERVDGQGGTPDAALRGFVKRMRESGQAFSVE